MSCSLSMSPSSLVVCLPCKQGTALGRPSGLSSACFRSLENPTLSCVFKYHVFVITPQRVSPAQSSSPNSTRRFRLACPQPSSRSPHGARSSWTPQVSQWQCQHSRHSAPNCGVLCSQTSHPVSGASALPYTQILTPSHANTPGPVVI